MLDRATAGRAGMGVAATERPVTYPPDGDLVLAWLPGKNRPRKRLGVVGPEGLLVAMVPLSRYLN